MGKRCTVWGRNGAFLVGRRTVPRPIRQMDQQERFSHRHSPFGSGTWNRRAICIGRCTAFVLLCGPPSPNGKAYGCGAYGSSMCPARLSVFEPKNGTGNRPPSHFLTAAFSVRLPPPARPRPAAGPSCAWGASAAGRPRRRRPRRGDGGCACASSAGFGVCN